jgi:3-methyladenine DNA glycosylase AlkD
MIYQELEKHLIEISDAKYASFSKSLSNSEYISMGVKIPVLKSLVKEHKDDQDLKPSDFKLGKYLEIDFIYFALSLIRCKNVDEQLLFLEKDIGKAKSWAVTDTITSYLKKLTFDKYWSFFVQNRDACYIFTRRMAFILGLKFYKDEKIVNILPYIRKNEDYMVMMAEAWLMATIAITHEDAIFDYLSKCDDLALKRKTISKICDSFRFDEKSKERFKSLR